MSILAVLTIAMGSNAAPASTGGLLERPIAPAAVGQEVKIKAVAGLESADDLTVLMRDHGNQKTLEPLRGPGGEWSWSFTPKVAGAYIVAASREPQPGRSEASAFSYEKHFLRIPPRASAGDAERRPSASAAARFGHRLEIEPLVDPTCLILGADLPLRVKSDSGNLEGAEVIAVCSAPAGGQPQDNAPDAEQSITLKTVSGGFAVLPIRRAGHWSVTVRHRSGPDKKAPAAAGKPAAGADKSSGDIEFVAAIYFTVNAPAEHEGTVTKHEAQPPKSSDEKQKRE